MREMASKIAFHFLGTPYIWGGDDPMRGFDCSGFVQEVLRSVGALAGSVDLTAQDLYYHFRPWEVAFPVEGCLVFFGADKKNIRHVEYCLSPNLSIGASGGGSKTLSIQDAINQNAYIKIRPLIFREEKIAYVDPFSKP